MAAFSLNLEAMSSAPAEDLVRQFMPRVKISFDSFAKKWVVRNNGVVGVGGTRDEALRSAKAKLCQRATATDCSSHLAAFQGPLFSWTETYIIKTSCSSAPQLRMWSKKQSGETFKHAVLMRFVGGKYRKMGSSEDLEQLARRAVRDTFGKFYISADS